MVKENKWNEIVINSLLVDKDFDIKEVNNFESIKCLLLDKETYKLICVLINQKDWEGIKLFDNGKKTGFGEYLDIIRFRDQKQNLYAATIYDSNELWQDPQIIDIILLT